MACTRHGLLVLASLRYRHHVREMNACSSFLAEHGDTVKAMSARTSAISFLAKRSSRQVGQAQRNRWRGSQIRNGIFA